MIERHTRRMIALSSAMGLLLGFSSAGVAQQQTQGYYPYGYYQAPQPGNYQWAPRNDTAQASSTPQPSAPAQASRPVAPSPANVGSGGPQPAPTMVNQAQVQTPAQPQAGAYKPPVVASQAGNGMPLPAGMQVVQSRLGGVLADAQGRTLYIFDKEAAGVPLCEGECARLWPPFLSDGKSAMAAPFFVVSREDGSRQWAWNGRPLYHWIGDGEAGDVTGDGMNGVWHAVRVR